MNQKKEILSSALVVLELLRKCFGSLPFDLCPPSIESQAWSHHACIPTIQL